MGLTLAEGSICRRDVYEEMLAFQTLDIEGWEIELSPIPKFPIDSLSKCGLAGKKWCVLTL